MKKKYGITTDILKFLCELIKKETFTDKNFLTPRSIDKAVNMMIYNVPTPYSTQLKSILMNTIGNNSDQDIQITKDRILKPQEMIPWLEMIQLKIKENEVTNK